MSGALNGHDSESANDIFTKQLKNEAAKEVVKKYKRVTFQVHDFPTWGSIFMIPL